MKIKLRLWAVVALVLAVVGFGGYKLLKRAPEPVPSPSPVATTNSYLLDCDGIKQGETAFSILKDYLDQKVIPYNTKAYDFGIFVENINGQVSGADMAWIYFVNGQSGSIAADKYVLKAGDKVEWKYVRPEF